MRDSSSSTPPNWYWSQRGVTMGPVAFEELRRLMGERSINAESWIYHPLQGAWVQASTVPELVDAAPRPSVAPPPDAPAPSVVYCRFCGAPAASTATQCSACGRPLGMSANFALDAKTTAIVCRASIAASVMLPVVAAVIPAVLWAVNPKDENVVREAKASLNCHITMLIVWVAAFIITVVGAIVLVGPIIGALMFVAVTLYALVVGILGVVAASQDKPFEYPASLKFIP